MRELTDFAQINAEFRMRTAHAIQHRLGGVERRGRNFQRLYMPIVFIENHEVGEGAANVNCDAVFFLWHLWSIPDSNVEN